MANNKENSGSLWKNNRKEKDTHPDYTGSINVGGVEFWLNAWVKEWEGQKFFSMSVKPKQAPAEVPSYLPAGTKEFKEETMTEDNSLPF